MLWQAATVPREHRGDGHLAALLTAGLDPVEALASPAAVWLAVLGSGPLPAGNTLGVGKVRAPA